MRIVLQIHGQIFFGKEIRFRAETGGPGMDCVCEQVFKGRLLCPSCRSSLKYFSLEDMEKNSAIRAVFKQNSRLMPCSHQLL